MRTIVVIPTYNERGNVAPLVQTLSGLGLNIEILFVDDNSPDGTGALLDEIAEQSPLVSVMHRPEKLGLGSAYITGFQVALARKPDCIIQMDADLSHDPKDIPRLLSAVESHDLVTGSRYIPGGGVVRWPIHRLALSYLANLYVRWVTGIKIRDCTAGFKCFRRSVLEGIPLDRVVSNGYAFQIEMAYRVWKEGCRVKEVPITFWERTSGRSKLSGKVIWEAILLPWKIRLGRIR
jgi:dolichol-phosphate mannosyltransferase